MLEGLFPQTLIQSRPNFLLSWRFTTGGANMIVEEQISARQQRARKAIQRILTEPAGQAYGDYVVQSASGRKYRVAMRGPSVFENFCSCADFAVNTLGTCKHIEALLLRLHRRFGRSFNNQRYQRTRASLSLHYGDTLNVRLRFRLSHQQISETLSPNTSIPMRIFERAIFDDSSKFSRSCGPWTRRLLFTAMCWISLTGKTNLPPVLKTSAATSHS
jgi:predicted nucleic acid-binding Zn finger protein